MLRTALLSALLVLAGYASAAWLTHDFQVWTAEGARRLEVAQQPVPVPPVTVEGAGIVAQSLPTLLAQGGGVALVDFVYTRCQTVCLSLGSIFQQMQADLLQERAAATAAAVPTGSPVLSAPSSSAAPHPATVRLLSISFDSAHDTPAALQAYARQLQADPSVWQFLRVPDPEELAQLLRRFEVVVVPDGRGDFEHNAALLVVGPEGRLVRVFDTTERELALNYARHLARSQVVPASGAANVGSADNASMAMPVPAFVAALTPSIESGSP